MKSTSDSHNGFTLVELVVVILLLSILSVYAASRYIGSSSFSPYAAQEQAISIIRQIQLGRMQSNIDSTNTLSDEYRLSVVSNTSNTINTISCLGSVASCSATDSSRSNNLVLPEEVTFEPSMTVDFDLLGEPTPSNVRIDIKSPTETVGVCINSVGYVYGC
ncbi:prepilin-type N-terminal cleavage/methylation domain-containing protein [Vibrio sp. DW001]|uniref:prepilin-type N-terminal cleavage/methylation domain-containing protein n=1 Tax=Vibrio sp. DW001 TaxID=2912315 RepID=UPI0023B15162|nr:prepilin-type N-terminal cleavage/methylation domain-containing protein [Vibrio sp. DW001]WED26393.1 prepilin-type N-terminal cleavage/methylation domain-containing protein [Vibrio sp. DW001]